MLIMKTVFSSFVDAIGYDDDTQELHVKYRNGKEGVYKNVPPDKAEQVISAPSVGTALHELIRNQHPHEYTV